MSLNDDIYTELSGHSGLSALVSNRIYPSVLPQNTAYPAVVFQRISAVRVQTLDLNTDGPRSSRYQFRAWSKDMAEANSVAEQVRLAMEAATAFRALFDIDLEDYESDTLLYSVVADYSIRSA